MSSIALKFTSLLVRTLAKPIANGIKGQAKQHPAFRKTCITIAQTVHQADTRLRLSLLGGSKAKVRPLNDARAIETGANFLSETFIFSVAAGLILFETNRQRKKEQVRRETVADDIKALQDEIEWLKRNLKEQKLLKQEYQLPEDVKPSILHLGKEETNAQKVDHANSSETSGGPGNAKVKDLNEHNKHKDSPSLSSLTSK